MNQSLRETISEYVKNSDANTPHIDIAQKIIDDGKSDLSLRTLRLRVSEYRNDDDAEIEGSVERESRWQVTDDMYYIYKKKTSSAVKFPVKLIDKMFLDYSRHGYNMTSTQVIHKYDLKVEEWHLIKNALRLYKDSNIFSPYTVETTPREELNTIVEDQMDKLFRNKVIVEKNYEKALHREYKKSVQNDNFRILEVSAFLDKLAEEIPHLPPVQIREVIPQNGEGKEATVVLADLHTGAEVATTLSRTPRFDLDILIGKLKQVAGEINRLGFSKVNVVLLGDIIESFTGMNHKNSWKGIQKGLWGSGVVIAAYELIVKFVNELNGFNHLYVVGGNHDRSTSDNKEDVTSEITQILTYFLSKPLGEERVTNFGDIGSFLMGKINFIPTHGHLWLSKQNAAAMAWKYGMQGYFNLILEGHLHSRIVKPKDDGSDFRKIICPSIFSGNRYSDQGGWDASAGYIVITEKENGTPRIYDECI